MRSSESTAAISEALVRFLAGIQNPAKTKDGGGGAKRYKYAELPDILDQVRADLGSCLLSLTMECITEGPTVGVTARMVHTSGEWIEYGPLMLPAGNDAQSAGSALTYARRYLLCAVLNIAADEDDDGAKVSKKRPEPEAYGEGASGSGVTGGGEVEDTGGGRSSPPPPEPHEHIPGRPLSNGNHLCKFEFPDGRVCGKSFRLAPTIHTAPVEEVEVRKDLVG